MAIKFDPAQIEDLKGKIRDLESEVVQTKHYLYSEGGI
jgi:hypothetical protein